MLDRQEQWQQNRQPPQWAAARTTRVLPTIEPREPVPARPLLTPGQQHRTHQYGRWPGDQR